MLPTDICYKCASYLSLQDYVKLRQSDKFWKSITENPRAMPELIVDMEHPHHEKMLQFHPKSLRGNVITIPHEMKSVKIVQCSDIKNIDLLPNLEILGGINKAIDVSKLTKLTTVDCHMQHNMLQQLKLLPNTVTSLCIHDAADVIDILKEMRLEKLWVTQSVDVDYSQLSIQKLIINLTSVNIKIPPSLRELVFTPHSMSTLQNITSLQSLYLRLNLKDYSELAKYAHHLNPIPNVKLNIVARSMAGFPDSLLSKIVAIRVFRYTISQIKQMCNVEYLKIKEHSSDDIKISANKFRFGNWPHLNYMKIGMSDIQTFYEIVAIIDAGAKPINDFPRDPKNIHRRDAGYMIRVPPNFPEFQPPSCFAILQK